MVVVQREGADAETRAAEAARAARHVAGEETRVRADAAAARGERAAREAAAGAAGRLDAPRFAPAHVGEEVVAEPGAIAADGYYVRARAAVGAALDAKEGAAAGEAGGGGAGDEEELAEMRRAAEAVRADVYDTLRRACLVKRAAGGRLPRQITGELRTMRDELAAHEEEAEQGAAGARRAALLAEQGPAPRPAAARAAAAWQRRVASVLEEKVALAARLVALAAAVLDPCSPAEQAEALIARDEADAADARADAARERLAAAGDSHGARQEDAGGAEAEKGRGPRGGDFAPGAATAEEERMAETLRAFKSTGDLDPVVRARAWPGALSLVPAPRLAAP